MKMITKRHRKHRDIAEMSRNGRRLLIKTRANDTEYKKRNNRVSAVRAMTLLGQ